MNKIILAACFLAATLATSAQSEAEMKAWNDYMTPGDMHKQLNRSIGNWKADVTMWMAPGTDPVKSTGTVKNESIMDGRYIQGTFTGDFMGRQMNGSSITGYDNAKKVFISTWIDNFGTGIMILEGKWNAQKKAIEFKGKQTDPMTGKDLKVRETLSYLDDGSELMEMWMEQNGKEFKTMEIRFSKM